jgi:periplasmic copper chaperone A
VPALPLPQPRGARATHRPGRRLARRAGAVLLAAAVPVLVVAGAASAHVTVHSEDATQGGYGKITFRVPNETDNADTMKLQVFFPQSQPLASVSIQPHPGWSFQVKTVKLTKPISSDDGQVTQAVSEVVWTADSKATSIQPGEFDEFNVSAGPLPKASTMVFKALQTYSDGTIVRWIDPTPPGGAEPEHPAPVLTLAAATSDDATSTAVTASSSGSSSGGSSSNGRATTALVLSVVALVVALGAGGAGLLRRSRS